MSGANDRRYSGVSPVMFLFLCRLRSSVSLLSLLTSMTLASLVTSNTELFLVLLSTELSSKLIVESFEVMTASEMVNKF